MLAAQPVGGLGQPGVGGGLAHDPDLRRPAVALELVRMRRDLARRGLHSGHPGRPGRHRAGPGDRHGRWQPDLLRHGGLQPDEQQHRRGAGLPGGVDHRASRRRATCRASTPATPRASRTWCRSPAPATSSPTSSGSPTGTTSRPRPIPTFRPPSGRHTSVCTSTGARHNETYGGATINIDGDYLDAATAAAGTGSGVDCRARPRADTVAEGDRRS